MTWINSPLLLESQSIKLLSLEKTQLAELKQIAREESIWQHYAYDVSESRTFDNAFNRALEDLNTDTQFTFSIYSKEHQKLIGSTRFLAIDPAHKKLEIGWTWLHPDYWGTGLNESCKLLLLTYAFETLGAVRVQLKTDELNTRSRKAILKIGAKFEGILRNDMIREDDSNRHSAYYSIIHTEWPEVKINLTKLVG